MKTLPSFKSLSAFLNEFRFFEIVRILFTGITNKMGKKAAETTMAKRKMGTLIHVRATALHSKGNKSHLARLHGPKYKDKKLMAR